MVDARITAKTTLPDLTRAIPRPRLVQRVARATQAHVTLITGQAAQGKSTLAAELARQPGPACAWMHLDASDRDPVNLFRLLVHALNTALPELEVSPFLKNTAVTLGTKTRSGRIIEMTAALMEACTAVASMRLVMDGIDAFSSTPECLMMVERVREAISSSGQLILVSREIPPLQLESLRIRRELIALTNDDLAFSIDEIASFFKELYGLQLEKPQLKRIGDLTGGWAGGLVLVWEALQHVPENQRVALIENGLPTALRGDRLSYFSEEVFSRLDKAARSFLIRASIFNTIDPRVATRCLEEYSQTKVEAILKTMVRKNLFIQPLLDPATGWGYRLNQLFRDFLRDKFKHTLDRDTQRRIYARAADVAWCGESFEEAIHFFLKAAAYDKAAAGIKKIAMGLSAQGRFADLAGWIDALPEAMLDDDPWLAFYRAMAHRISGGRRNIESFGRAYERFKAEGDRRGQILALAYLIEAAVFIGHPAAELNRWLQDGWSLLEAASVHRYYPFAKTVLWMQVAFGYLSAAGDLQKGLSACRNALLLANTIGDDTLTMNATVIHAFGLTLAGEFAAAEEGLDAIDRQTGAAYPEYRALKNIVHMELALSRGDLDGAQKLLDINRKHIDSFGLLFLYPIHVDLTGLLQIHQGRFEALGRTARHLQDVATLAANPFYHGLAMRLRALNAYHRGRYEPARRWAAKAAERIAGNLGENVHRFRCRLIMGMASYHLGELAAARKELEAAQEVFSRVSCKSSLVEARLGLSLIERAAGDAGAAGRLLDAALTMAATKGYDALPLLSAADIRTACVPACQSTHPEAAGMARHLLDRLPADSAILESQPTEQTLPVRALVQGGADDVQGPLVDIRTLGGFEVRRSDGKPIADEQWGGNRQKLMLKAIVVNGCREIPRDVLMDAIWPDSEAAVAAGRFKVTLHRLRRILEPHRNNSGDSSCISLKDHRVSLDSLRCQVDVNDFLAACDAIRQSKREDNDDHTLSACRRAVELYGGDFLPEEPYLSWADMKRTALREQYLGVLMEMAVLFERSDDLEEAIRCCRRVIGVDPLAEHAHQRLMTLFLRQGRRSEALKIYRDLEKRLAMELDTVPDLETTRMYAEICKRPAEG